MTSGNNAGEQNVVEQALDAAREELGVRCGFPPEVQAAAEQAATRVASAGTDREDRRDLPLVTIDPPGSRDLDQALFIESNEAGAFVVWYAIADVGFFVDRGGAVEAEAWKRGLTVYGPDRKEPLYPPVLSQGAASLLPDEDRPAILFRFDVDAAGALTGTDVRRALVRSRAQLTYAQVVEHVDGGGRAFAGKAWADGLTAMRAFGELRQQVEAARGGVSIPLVDQHVTNHTARRLGYALEFETPKDSEEWNEQVSLLTGHAAARLMLDAKVGMVRVMGPPDPDALDAFRRAAGAMGFRWPRETSYPDFIRSLDLKHPGITPLLWQARRVNRGADYLAFDGAAPTDPLHHALAMPYAHATAPLRRLGDRYVLDLLVQLCAGARPSAAEVETLRRLPAVMDEAERRESKFERRAVDVAEAWVLRDRVGERFAATVLGARGGDVEVQIEDPPVRALADVRGRKPAPGDAVRVVLDRVDVPAGRVFFALAGTADGG
ncbi:RNB domain-containing ribonuclease [Longimicrobium sp.]|uniref:RNB domain-containing ribonuclease n=1 Tax=Longimicrobium sp. TaxID=2029185 RepID=UPI002E373479|nr:RNB domain-containing ribonuclease [Longimicrobium sp.]HEX6042513.1 RNB domain-containing ribonuclease [Longimicrobium sp.]